MTLVFLWEGNRIGTESLGERQRMSLATARRRLKAYARDGSPGRYWVEDDGVPMYGVNALDEPKTERVKSVARPHPTLPGGYYTGEGFHTRTVPGEVQRRLKPGNMPWNR